MTATPSTSDCCCCAQVHLSGQELAVIELVAQGMSNVRIGHCLNLSEHTVASYMASAMRRAVASNRAELVAKCFVAGVLRPDAWPPAATGRTCVTPVP